MIYLQVPPLRERQEDIPLLAQHFLWRYATETNKKIDSIQPEAMEAMRRYPWPGNVRELENAIERAVVMGKTRQIKLSDLPLAIPLEGAAEMEKLSMEEVERQHIARVLATGGGICPTWPRSCASTAAPSTRRSRNTAWRREPHRFFGTSC